MESKRDISMKQEQTHKHTEQDCGCQGGKDWRLGISRWNLCIEWIKNERFLFSILPYIIMEKNIYVELNQFAVWQNNFR